MLRYYRVVVVACLLLVGWLDAVGQLAFGFRRLATGSVNSLVVVDLVHVGVVLLEIDLHVDGSVHTPVVLPVVWPSRTPLFAIRMAVL